MYLFGSAPSLTQVLSGRPAATAAPALNRAPVAPTRKPAAPAKKVAQVPVQVKIYAGVLTALAAVVLLGWAYAFPASDRLAPRIAESSWTLPLVFAGLIALSLLFPIHMARNSKLILADGAFFAALLLFGPVIAMLMAGLGSLVANVTLLAGGKRGPWSVLFN